MDWADLVVPALSVPFAAGGAWVAVRAELKSIRRDVDRHESAIDKLHSRINRVTRHSSYKSN